MEEKELTEKISSLRTYIEKKINSDTEIHFDAEVYFDEISVSMMGSDRYCFRIFIKRNLHGKALGLKYSIPSWGAIDPNEDLAQLFRVYGMMVGDKELSGYILEKLDEINGIVFGLRKEECHV